MGRGSRARKEVDYSDSLTEKEWRKVNIEIRIFLFCVHVDSIFSKRFTQAIGDTYDDEDDEDDEEVKTTKRTTRKRKKRGSIIDDEEDEDDPSVSYQKKKRPDKVNDEKLKRQMRRIMDIVVEYKNE